MIAEKLKIGEIRERIKNLSLKRDNIIALVKPLQDQIDDLNVDIGLEEQKIWEIKSKNPDLIWPPY